VISSPHTTRTPTALVVLVTLAIAGGARAEQGGAFHEVPLPGGAAALARAAGLDPAIEPWRVVVEVIRRVHFTGDQSLSAQVQSHLREAATHAGGELALLPLAPQFWEASVFEAPAPGELLARILANRNASLLYHGLMDLDETTLVFLSGVPETLTTVHRRHAEAFALFAGSFRIREGVVAVPGGDDGVPPWEWAVGRSVRQPDEFLLALYGRDHGRLASLYDSLAGVEPSAVRFALGLDLDAGRRRHRLRALMDAFGAAEPWWQKRGFRRPEVDAARVLREVRVRSGELAPPARRALWDAVFAEGPLAPPGAPAGGEANVDAAWLVTRVAGATPGVSVERLSALTFAQRILNGADQSSPDVLLTLRGFLRHPALLLTLERIGAREPGLLASCVRRAHQLSVYPDPRRAASAIAQFQGALGLVDRARVTGALDPPAAEALVRTLVGIQPLGGLRYYGAIARFIDQELLPALAGGGPPEERLSRALVGPPARAPVRVTWRGSSYLLADDGIERDRIARALRRLGGNPLDHVLDFCRTAAAMAAAPPTAEALQAHLLALEEAAQGLAPAGLNDLGPPVDAVAVVAEARRLSETAPVDGEGAPIRLAQPAIAAGETLLATSLATLQYALHIGPADGPALGASDVAGRHDLGYSALTPAERELTAWRLPRVAQERPWRMRGSLLALEIGLAPFALRRISNQPPDGAPSLSFDADRAGFAQGVALMSAMALTDASRDGLVEALRRGRGRVERAGADARELERLAEQAGVAGWRRNTLAWLSRRGEGSQLRRFFTLMELLQLGDREHTADAWGVSDVPSDGLLTRLPDARSWDELLGHQGRLAPRIPDLNLRIAEALAERALPARLAPAVLAFAIQDLLDAAQPVSAADGYSVARYARDLSGERVDDYIEALAKGGLLRRITDGGHEPAAQAAP